MLLMPFLSLLGMGRTRAGHPGVAGGRASPTVAVLLVIGMIALADLAHWLVRRKGSREADADRPRSLFSSKGL